MPYLFFILCISYFILYFNSAKQSNDTSEQHPNKAVKWQEERHIKMTSIILQSNDMEDDTWRRHAGQHTDNTSEQHAQTMRGITHRGDTLTYLVDKLYNCQIFYVTFHCLSAVLILRSGCQKKIHDVILIPPQIWRIHLLHPCQMSPIP